jgi:heme/copper-type cytochrome/quinol oxidase subunit 3
MSSLGPILAGLGFIGIIGEGIYSATTIKSKLSSTDWGLMIFMPTFICLFLIILGMYMIFKNNATQTIDSAMFYPLIIFMAAGNIALTSIVILFSEHVVNWQSN